VESRSSLLRDSGLELGSKVLPNSDSELCSGVLHNWALNQAAARRPMAGRAFGTGLRRSLATLACPCADLLAGRRAGGRRLAVSEAEC
jgi:hypothetical protein